MAIIDGMLQELEMEAQTTRRVLERVPDDKLAWRPHARARTLGELALHIAQVPGNVAQIAMQSPVQAPQFTDPSPRRASELIPALDQSIAKAKSLLGGMDDQALMSTWRMMHGDRDSVIPFGQGQALFEKIHEPKRFFTIAGGDHNDAEPRDAVTYWRAIDDFIASLRQPAK